MMDEEIIESISLTARQEDAEERRRFGPRLRRLCAGDLSEQEEAVLQVEAEVSEEARLDYEAFRPLGEGFYARMVRVWREIFPYTGSR